MAELHIVESPTGGYDAYLDSGRLEVRRAAGANASTSLCRQVASMAQRAGASPEEADDFVSRWTGDHFWAFR